MIMIREIIRPFIAWLLLSIGMWKLAHKMDWKKKWMAWVPGLRYLGLADDLEMHADGINCAILEILYYMTITGVFLQPLRCLWSL